MSNKKSNNQTIDTSLELRSIEEDKVWGEMSEKARKEGLLSDQESEKLLKRMKNA